MNPAKSKKARPKMVTSKRRCATKEAAIGRCNAAVQFSSSTRAEASYAFPPTFNHFRIFAIRVLVIGPLYARCRVSPIADSPCS